MKYFVMLAAGLIISGCAGAPKLSQEQIQQKYQSIAKLDQDVQSAQLNNVNLLAPKGYSSAEQGLTDAYSAAKKDQAAAAEKYARQGLISIDQANVTARKSAELLSDVLDARSKALKAGSQELFPKEMAVIEKDLSKATALVESGNLEAAKRARPELLKSYSGIELKSVKEGTVQRAKVAIAHARENDAHKLAPKTFKKAEESLAAAISILEADRTARNRAEASAKEAQIEAVRSENISELVRDYDRRDFTHEDIVLWYQDQVSKITSPLNKKLNFNEANKLTVGTLQQSIAALVQDRASLTDASSSEEKTRAMLVKIRKDSQDEISQLKLKHEQEITNLKKQFAGEKTELTQAQIQQEARFKQVQKTFDKSEANVYRQGDNVLISVHGFKFPSGSGEIQPQNFGTMNKIVQSIKSFPSAKVKVSGHTDITGNNKINLDLSEQRAENVALFLIDIGHIPADRILVEGYGSERPVASNSTAKGRAENRRIEVLIINE